MAERDKGGGGQAPFARKGGEFGLKAQKTKGAGCGG